MDLYLYGAVALGFLAGILIVYATWDWMAQRVASERGGYEQIVGKELYRLFLDISPQQFLLIHVAVIFGSIVVCWLLLETLWLAAPVGFVAGLFLPRIYLKHAWKKRIAVINEQVEEAMIFMANSFKANPSLPEALQDVCNSMGPPITEEFNVMLKEYRLGTPLDVAMINLQKRVPARYLQLAVSALLIGRTVGGNIPKILEDISSTVRESYRLERVIDTQTAQGRMQAWVMGAMPSVVIGVFYYMDPALIRPLFDTFFGYLIIGLAVVLNIVGVFLIIKIMNIDV